MVMEDVTKNASDAGRATVAETQKGLSESTTDKRPILLNSTRFSGNTLKKKGPIVLFVKLEHMMVCCGLECVAGEALKKGSCIAEDPSEEGHPVMGTFMSQVGIEPREGIVGYLSGTDIPEFNVTLEDELSNEAPLNATLVISSGSKELELFGAPKAKVIVTGSFPVSGIKAKAVPGQYYITLNVDPVRDGAHPLEKNVTLYVRTCRIGEHALEDGKGCANCTAGFYNFHPNTENCTSCPKYIARCDGETVIPLEHYWQSSSHTSRIYNCLNRNSCTYAGREKALRKMAQENITLERTWDKGYPLCNEVHAQFNSDC